MSQPAKLHEPTMEEILASIRRIIAEDDLRPSPSDTPVPAEPAPDDAEPPVRNEMAERLVDGPMSDVDPAGLLGERETPWPSGRDADVARETCGQAAPAIHFATITPAAFFDPPRFVAASPEPPESPRNLPSREPTLTPPPEASKSDVREAGLAKLAPSRSVMPESTTPELAPPPLLPRPGEEGLLSPGTTAAVERAFDRLAETILLQNSRTLENLVREMLRPMLKAWLDANLPDLVERLVRAEIERAARGRS